MIGPLLYQRLRAGVPLVNNRVYWGEAIQQAPAPYLIANTLPETREYSHGGFSSLSLSRMQVDCYSEQGFENANAVAEEVTATLESWTGADKVQAVFRANKLDMFEQDTGLYRVMTEFIIWHGN